MSPFLRSKSSKTKARKCKQEANLKLKNILRSKSCIKRVAKSLQQNKNKLNTRTNAKLKMGQKFSIFVRRGPSNIKTKSFDESELRATNIDEAPHPNETLALRIKRFGPTNVVLVIRTNATTDDLVPLSNASPSHSSSSSSVYLRIHAHREVLCMRSKYFYSMLQGPNRSRFKTSKGNCEEILDDELEFCDQNDDEIDLISIYRKTPSEMADMVGQVLHFLYFDERALNPENAQTLLEAANYFQVICRPLFFFGVITYKICTVKFLFTKNEMDCFVIFAG